MRQSSSLILEFSIAIHIVWMSSTSSASLIKTQYHFLTQLQKIQGFCSYRQKWEVIDAAVILGYILQPKFTGEPMHSKPEFFRAQTPALKYPVFCCKPVKVWCFVEWWQNFQACVCFILLPCRKNSGSVWYQRQLPHLWHGIFEFSDMSDKQNH